jgi:hypothetical protein
MAIPATLAIASTPSQLLVAKIYTEDQKYDGTNGNFDHKLQIFTDIFQRVELPEQAYMKAFPIMLKGLAPSQYYDAILSQHTFEDACARIRSFFEGPNFHRRNLDEWNGITSILIISLNPGKTTY